MTYSKRFLLIILPWLILVAGCGGLPRLPDAHRTGGGRTISERPGRPVPTRFGVSASSGQVYDPNVDRGQMALLTGFVLLDHDHVTYFDTPEFLRFKLEATLGGGLGSTWDGIAAVNMLTLCYIDRLASEEIRPYVEGGIGIMYSGHRWEGQAYNLLFNPVAGVGMHITPEDGGGTYQLSLRLFHGSNGSLHSDNKGMNAVLLSVGYLF